MLQHSNPASIVLLVLFLGPVLYFIRKANKGIMPKVRRIAGIDAIDDAIGRTVELGRPISFTSGLTGVTPLLYAVLGVLRHIAQKSAVFRSRLFVPCSDPESLALTDATLQNAYRSVKRFDQYNPCLLYTSPSPRDATLSRMPSSA